MVSVLQSSGGHIAQAAASRNSGESGDFIASAYAAGNK
jgi:hypothetical protein